MIKDIFYLPQNRTIAFLVCIAYILVFAKFYEKFIQKKVRDKFKFLNDRDKEICFEIFVTGFIGFLLLLLMKIIGFRIHYFWWVMGILTSFGGALGLIPCSFIKK